MSNNDEQTWYNVKHENGKVSIEKKGKNEINHSKNIVEYRKNTNKKRTMYIFIVFVLVISLFLLVTLLSMHSFNKHGKKNRTFMIYMVGSDLESNGKIATYDLQDLIDSNINLKENNVVLIVGGSKKWHNFVKEKEISIYELTSTGFKKQKTQKYMTMGSESLLSNFLTYSYKNYPASKYDLLFWNHGLGAAGIESDEVFDDYLSIKELDNALNKSPFNEEKLETVIFNNCLSGSIHFANIMSKYADYMVASEEVMYVGASINRLNFIENVKENDNGYDVGLYYVNSSDSSISNLNQKGSKYYDSTLSIIDLSKINNLDNRLNEFFNSINIEENYFDIAKARRKTYTYSADTGYSYDTVDLYELIEYLSPYVNDFDIVDDLLHDIESAVVYNSSMNTHSKGLSVYFPFYGNTEYVETHLMYFKQLWNNNYINFINEFYERNYGIRKARRAKNNDMTNYLENEVKVDNNSFSIKLSSEEKDLFQNANVYIFSKKDGNLLLKSSDVVLENDKLLFKNNNVLKMGDYYISLFYDDNYKIYGSIDDVDVIEKLDILNNNIRIMDVFIDSGNSPINGIFDYSSDSNNSFYSFNYNFNDEFDEEWFESFEKNKIDYSQVDELVLTPINFNDCYCIFEMKDINNDVFYSKINK